MCLKSNANDVFKAGKYGEAESGYQKGLQAPSKVTCPIPLLAQCLILYAMRRTSVEVQGKAGHIS